MAEALNPVENQEKPRTPSEIIAGLLQTHEQVAKGEKSGEFLVKEQLKGAKEMLANGEEDKAFLLMATAFQTETALMGRKTAEVTAGVTQKMFTVVGHMDETSDKFGRSIGRLSESAQQIETASRRMGSR